jgi:hypothetical protein
LITLAVMVGALIALAGTARTGGGYVYGASCGQTITQNTKLTSDIHCTGDGLQLGASGITLDLGGYTIKGDANGLSDLGVFIDSRHGVTVKNGTISHFQGDNIGIEDANHVKLLNLKLLDSVEGDGVEADNADHLLIKHVFAARNEDNFDIDASHGVKVIHATAKDTTSGQGFELDDNSRMTVRRSKAINSFEHGFDLNNVDRSLFVGNLALRNGTEEEGEEGFSIDDVDYTKFIRNDSIHNHRDGFRTERATYNLFENNLAKANGQDGFDFHEEPDGNKLVRNTAMANGDEVGDESGENSFEFEPGSINNTLVKNLAVKNFEDGFKIEYDNNMNIAAPSAVRALAGFGGGPVDYVLKSNISLKHGDDGFDVEDPNSKIIGNLAKLNDDWGFYAPNGSLGFGNVAPANGDPCFMVSCFGGF